MRSCATSSRPLVPVLARMELTGVALDTGVLDRARGASSGRDRGPARKDLRVSCGGEFNLDSPKQVGEVLFERLGAAEGTEDEDRVLDRRARARAAARHARGSAA